MVLGSDTILHRAAELDLSLESNGEVSVYVDRLPYRFGPQGLGLINAFNHPKPLAKALAELAPTGEVACDELISATIGLVEVGVLHIGPRTPAISQRPFPSGFYDSPGVQIRILNDRDRRLAYLRAVAETVRPGDVVLDLGTGSGILAVAAARAGARRVYAIEPANVSASARQIFERNGVADRITLIEGWSHGLVLPEKADVLTYDLVGSEPLEMKIVETTADALRRLTKPDVRVLPRRLTFSLVLVEVPPAFSVEYSYSPGVVKQWEDWYGIDFSPFLASVAQRPVSTYAHPHEAARFKRLAQPQLGWQLDLGRSGEAPLPNVEMDIEILAEGRLTGVFGMVEIEMSDSVTFSTDPASAGPAPHWMVPLWIVPDPIPVRPGQRARVSYRYEGRGRNRVQIRLADSTAPQVEVSESMRI
jgi:hypothetical protein